jgi:poly-gamma-glutamate capsule biosynthesis protein CapA/YwtB (metallophosphatase superfamily)
MIWIGALATALLLFAACLPQGLGTTILLGGDVILAREGKSISSATQPFGRLRKIIRGSTHFFINLESPLGTPNLSTGDMNLCAPIADAETLADVGVDLASLANNHRNDCEPGGDYITAEVLQAAGITPVSFELSPVLLETTGGRLAVVAVDEVSAALDEDSLIARIEQAAAHSDLAIVSIHWGNEYQAGPDERQTRLAQAMADAGADVIWGHHPHVLQRMEWLQRDGQQPTLVIYSLGNLLADQWMLSDAFRSALVKLTIRQGELLAVEITPISIQVTDRTPSIAKEGVQRDAILERLKVGQLSGQGVEITIR